MTRRVSVNGSLAHLGQRVDVTRDEVTVDGVVLGVRPGLVHYILNKPTGVIATARDELGRRCVVDMVPDEPRVFPVGRLDAETEGLLVLTNDGDLAHRLAHPSFGVEKEYLAEVCGTPGRRVVAAFARGIVLDDGFVARARASVVAPGTLKLVICEGHNREIRRMCDAAGYPVRRLVRTRIGPISDNRLSPGDWRILSPKEVRMLASAGLGTAKLRSHQPHASAPTPGAAGRKATARALAGPVRPTAPGRYL